MPIHTLSNDANIVTENPPSNIQAFRLACFEFQLCLSEATELPVYKGASFHGAFGQALARKGTNFRDYFYNPTPPAHWSDAQQAPPRPYVLIPPLEDKTRYAAGDTLNLGIILYGSAIDYSLIVFAALEHLGEFMGLGKQRGRFRIDSIRQLTGQSAKLLYQNRQWLGQAQSMHAGQFFTETPLSLSHIRLNHSTRLRLKAGNELLLRTAPPFSLLLNRLLGRINALATLYGNGIVITPEEKQHLLTLAETVQIEHSTLHWQDWQRHSQRTHSTMPFGGLLGETVYRGELAPFIPWLALGQWTGVGGKTSFGLGLYELTYSQWSEDEYY
ncbi:MAG: CRISPR system precrRNA processing endoribonuclease RAMP protein Cas6 [Methylococcaceae bacterium]